MQWIVDQAFPTDPTLLSLVIFCWLWMIFGGIVGALVWAPFFIIYGVGCIVGRYHNKSRPDPSQ